MMKKIAFRFFFLGILAMLLVAACAPRLPATPKEVEATPKEVEAAPTEAEATPAADQTESCRTAATSTHSVQTFIDGQVVTTDLTCTVNAGTPYEVICQGKTTDSVGGTGTVTQTSLFASRDDIVDEATVNPPRNLSLGTTTVTQFDVYTLTITATNSFDTQRRLTSTTIVNPPPLGQITMTFSAWDDSGRPTSGVVTLVQGTSPISISYDAANRSFTRNDGRNTCTVTHDENGIIIGETCTGTTGSTTVVTVNSTQQICK
jgi:hypothetical protein